MSQVFTLRMPLASTHVTSLQNDVGSLRKVQASEGSTQVLGGVQIVSDQALGKKVLKAVS